MRDAMNRFHAIVTGAAPLSEARGLVRDDGVDPIERLRVYAHAYFARIKDALAAEYPKLAALLGDARFTQLVSAYLEAHPTAHPSLREAGAHLPRFAREWQADLAALERARTEVFDAADATPLGRADLAEVAPEDFPDLPLRLVPASAIVELATNADELWAAVEDGTTIPAIAAGRPTVLVWRRDVTVIHRTLDDDEARAIRALADGATFAEVCAESQSSAGRALALLLDWLDAGVLLSAAPWRASSSSTSGRTTAASSAVSTPVRKSS